MFAGEYLCKVDEKGRFIVPSPIRERLEAEGSQVMFLKGAEQSLWVYSVKEWEKVLERTKTTLDDDQSRLFMHFIVSEAGTSEIDKAGRILIPGRLRKLVPLDEDQEVILVGLYLPYGSLEPVRVAPLCGQDGNAIRRKHGQDSQPPLVAQASRCSTFHRVVALASSFEAKPFDLIHHQNHPQMRLTSSHLRNGASWRRLTTESHFRVVVPSPFPLRCDRMGSL